VMAPDSPSATPDTPPAATVTQAAGPQLSSKLGTGGGKRPGHRAKT
jgi:hypothetical protein